MTTEISMPAGGMATLSQEIENIVRRVLDEKLAGLARAEDVEAARAYAAAARETAQMASDTANRASADAAAAKQLARDTQSQVSQTLEEIGRDVATMRTTVATWANAINRIDAFMQQRDERLEAVDNDLTRKEERLNGYGKDLDALQRDAAAGQEDRKSLRREMHGDGEHPDQPSIMGEIRDIKRNMAVMKATIETVQGDIHRLAQPGLASKLWKMAASNKLIASIVTAVLLALAAAIISLVAGAPAGQQFIQSLGH